MDYSYKNWKNEKSIEVICKKLLDNANMDLEIISYPLLAIFTFFVIGSDIKVIFKCRNIELFKIQKDTDEEALFSVLETHVEYKSNKTWEITVLPMPEISVHCTEFEWSLEKMTESERNM